MPPSFTYSDIREGYRCCGIDLAAPCILCIGWFGFLFMVAGALFTAFEFSVVQDAADINTTFQNDFWGNSAGTSEVKVSMLRVLGPLFLAIGFIMMCTSFVLCCLAYKSLSSDEPQKRDYMPVRRMDEEAYLKRVPAPASYAPPPQRVQKAPLQKNISDTSTPPTTDTPQGSPYFPRKQGESTTDTSYPPADTPPQGSPYAMRKPGSREYVADEFQFSKSPAKEIGV